MKTAHQGVQPVPLLGLSNGFGLGNGWAAPAPNATQAPAPRPAQPDDGGLDSWLLDKLFGRR